jgi:hypothetical protein
MSGPIVRRYGFPNFEQIFGKRELEHGIEEGGNEAEAATTAEPKEENAPAPATKEKKRKKGGH